MGLVRRYRYLCFAAVVLPMLVWWYHTAEESEQWRTVSVERRPLTRVIKATGRLDAVRKVDVGAQVSGQLQTLTVEVGDRVTQGQLLAIIDPQLARNQIKEVESTLRELEAQREQAGEEYRLASLTVKRKGYLAQTQALSRQELDEARVMTAVKKASIAEIDARIARNRATLDTANINLVYTRIVAPIAGVVTEITTRQGQTVIAAQQAPNILTLADLGTMIVNARVSEADVIHLRPGQKAWFTVLGDLITRYEGVLKDIQPTPEKINDAIFYAARFEVPNAHDLLRLDMTALVTIQLDDVSDALVVPLAALGEQIADNRYQLSVMEKDELHTRTVSIGASNDQDVQIFDGVKVGEIVVTGRREQGGN